MFAYGGVNPHTQQSLVSEMSYAVQRGIKVEFRSMAASALIDKARSVILTEWYRADTDGVLFMIDHDMQWQPGDVCETARLAAECQGVVGAIYAKKGFGLGLAGNDASSRRPLSLGTDDHAITSCENLSAGLMAIDRSVPGRLWNGLSTGSSVYREAIDRALADRDMETLETLIPLGLVENHPHEDVDDMPTVIDWFRPVRTRTRNGKWMWFGEDFSFSRRCVHCGIVPQINTRPMPVHWGERGYTIQDAIAKPPPDAGPGR